MCDGAGQIFSEELRKEFDEAQAGRDTFVPGEWGFVVNDVDTFWATRHIQRQALLSRAWEDTFRVELTRQSEDHRQGAARAWSELGLPT